MTSDEIEPLFYYNIVVKCFDEIVREILLAGSHTVPTATNHF